MQKRMLGVLTIFSISFFILAYRLFDISILNQKHFGSKQVNLIERSVAQRSKQFRIDNGRGKIVDVNNQILSAEYSPKVILFPILKDVDWPIDKLSSITGVPQSDIQRQLRENKECFVLQNIKDELTPEKIDDINLLHVPGLISMVSEDNIQTPKVVLFPFLKNTKWPIDKLSTITGVAKADIESQLEAHKQSFTLQNIKTVLTPSIVQEINSLGVPGLISINNNQIAEHLIGTTGENEELFKEIHPNEKYDRPMEIGVSGLQKKFEGFLFSDRASNLILHVDNLGKPMFGNEVKYAKVSNPFYPVTLQTTINKDIQILLEQAADQAKLQKGAIVLLDVKTNKLVGMVSRPLMNQTDLYHQGDISANNYALESATPGSVFKTVIAAAAIDQKVVTQNEKFNCNLTVRGNNQTDPKKRFGSLSFEQSMDQSCNFTFGELGQRLISKNDNMYDVYANKLGLYGQVGWEGPVYHDSAFKQFQNEYPTVIWKDIQKGTRLRESRARNTAIGQLNVKVSPLAVANMMSTIARGGSPKQVKVVDSVNYKNGTNMFTFEDNTLSEDYLNPETMDKLREMLRGVVTDPKGTGHDYNTLPYELAGKSGTAQLDEVKAKYNKWFAGFFPYSNPKYAFAVEGLDVNSDSFAVVKDTVKRMVNSLYLYETKNH